jgi:hypothetical protein
VSETRSLARPNTTGRSGRGSHAHWTPGLAFARARGEAPPAFHSARLRLAPRKAGANLHHRGTQFDRHQRRTFRPAFPPGTAFSRCALQRDAGKSGVCSVPKLDEWRGQHLRRKADPVGSAPSSLRISLAPLSPRPMTTIRMCSALRSGNRYADRRTSFAAAENGNCPSGGVAGLAPRRSRTLSQTGCMASPNSAQIGSRPLSGENRPSSRCST